MLELAAPELKVYESGPWDRNPVEAAQKKGRVRDYEEPECYDNF